MSDTMRMTGLSGIDTESMVKQLMKAEGMKMNTLKSKRQITSWRQEGYRAMAKNLSTFQDNHLSLTLNPKNSIRLFSNFNLYTSSVKSGAAGGEGDIKVTLGSSYNGNPIDMEVLAIAQKDKYESGNEIKSSILSTGLLLGELKAGDFMNMSLDNGRSTKIIFTEADVNASTDNVSFANVLNAKLLDAFKVDKLPDGDVQKVVATINGNGELEIIASKGHYATVSSGLEGENLLKVLGVNNGANTRIDANKSLEFLFPTAVGAGIDFEINGVSFTFDKTDSLKKMINDINNGGAGVKVSLDNLRNKVNIESILTGARNEIEMVDSSGFLQTGLFISTDKSTRVSEASDALFIYNGLLTSRESNDFSLEGALFSLSSSSVGKTFNVTGEKNNAQTMEVITGFVKNYNLMIQDLYKVINTARPKSGAYSYYEPMTDEQKNELSDREAEKWEEKAKTGLLHRDSIAREISNQMREMLYEPVILDDGTKIALYDIGITTTRKDGSIGLIEIDETKLLQSLSENGEAVAGLFTKSSELPGVTVKNRKDRLKDEGIGDRLNDIIRNANDYGGLIANKAGIEGTTSFSSNEITRDLTEQDKKIARLEETLKRKEAQYYKMFSGLEVAMTQANNQMGALQGLLQ